MAGSNPIVKTARRYGIPPGLFAALVRQESGGRQSARSPVGAIGLTQLMPATARGLGVNPYNAQQNLEGGAKYLRSQYDKFGRWDLALAAYNAGPGAVERYHGVPPYAETRNYVQTILRGQNVGPVRISAGPSAPAVRGRPPAAAATATGLSPVLGSLINSTNESLGLSPIPEGLFTQPALPANVLRPRARAGAAPIQPTATETKLKRGPTIRYIEHFASPYGLTVTSTTGGKHVRGSYHYRGRAVDFGGNPSRMAALATAALEHPRDFSEVFYTGPGNPGFFVKNGRVFPNSQLDAGIAQEHQNHVHVAR